MSVMSANPELQEKLRNFIEECGSQTKAARALGKSTATLSTYLNDRYNGNLSDFEKFLTETFEIKTNKFIDCYTERTGYFIQCVYCGTLFTSFKSAEICRIKTCRHSKIFLAYINF